MGILVADNSPLAAGTSVEFVGSGTPQSGHIHFMSRQGRDDAQSEMNLYGEFVAKAYKPFSVKLLPKGRV